MQNFLKLKGISTLIHYPIPPHKQECYKFLNMESLLITELIHDEVLSLPISSVILNTEVAYIVRILNTF